MKALPILILQGKDDLITTVENALRLYEEITHDSTSTTHVTELQETKHSVTVTMRYSSFKVIENAGHMLMYEQPALVNKHIVEFLEELKLM